MRIGATTGVEPTTCKSILGFVDYVEPKAWTFGKFLHINESSMSSLACPLGTWTGMQTETITLCCPNLCTDYRLSHSTQATVAIIAAPGEGNPLD